MIQKYRQLVRQTLNDTKGGEEIETAGDSFLLIFTKPSEAVRFALLSGVRIRELSQQLEVELVDRIAIHMGEVGVEQHAEGKRPRIYTASRWTPAPGCCPLPPAVRF